MDSTRWSGTRIVNEREREREREREIESDRERERERERGMYEEKMTNDFRIDTVEGVTHREKPQLNKQPLQQL